MTVKCGVDMVHIPSIVKLLQQEATTKIFFHTEEMVNDQPEHLAGVIAAKEAFFKALGQVPPRWQDVQISHESSGKPRIVVVPTLLTYKSCDVSISHEKDYAVAIVTIEL